MRLFSVWFVGFLGLEMVLFAVAAMIDADWAANNAVFLLAIGAALLMAALALKNRRAVTSWVNGDAIETLPEMQKVKIVSGDRNIYGPNFGGVQNTGDNVQIGRAPRTLDEASADRLYEMLDGTKPVIIENPVGDAEARRLADQIAHALRTRGMNIESEADVVWADQKTGVTAGFRQSDGKNIVIVGHQEQ